MSDNKIGKYIVTKQQIGRGAFSTIFKGYDSNNGNVFAVKEISIAGKKKVEENVKKELNILKRLNHNNIVQIHDYFFDNTNKVIYIIMDYFKNGDLSKFIKGKVLKEIYAKKYMSQLKAGLEYLYNNNIMHRDLKPHNILIDDNNDIKITDFGFARYVKDDMLINTLCGTPIYMAPEIMKYKKYNNKSDLWSLGIIMYEMIFGKLPFKANNFIQLLKSINKNNICYKYPDIEISGDCENLLKSLLQIEPENRISWNEFFDHSWFKHDTEMEMTNRLMEISINNTDSLPSPSKLGYQSKQFYSFRHKSIQGHNSGEIKQISHQSVEDKKNSLDDLEFNTLFENSIGASTSTSSDRLVDDESDSNSYKSMDEEPESESEDNKYLTSKPIPTQNMSNTVYVCTKNENRFLNDSMIRKDIVIVDDDDEVYTSNSYPLTNENGGSLSNSFRGYLSTSYNFLKMSFNYLKTI
jgi:serine/threonine protein kinase